MNGVHDMGGMHGFGPIEREEHEPVFHAPWEGRVRAMMNLTIAGGHFNLDEFRYGIERMDPAAYLSSSYYARWLETVAWNLVQKGVITAEELEARVQLLQAQPDGELPRADAPPAPRTGGLMGEPPELPHLRPRFQVGDSVVTRNRHPAGHTRLPRYLRGKRGAIHLIHGAEIFPDAAAHGRDAPPQVVYNVRFDGHEVWGESAEPNATYYIDLWESYLEPAP